MMIIFEVSSNFSEAFRRLSMRPDAVSSRLAQFTLAQKLRLAHPALRRLRLQLDEEVAALSERLLRRDDVLVVLNFDT